MNVFRIAFVSIAIPCAALAAPIELMEGVVVAFAGGTDLVRLQNDGRFEAALTKKFKATKPKFRDFAWDGDTVSFQTTVRGRWRPDAFGSWDDQLKRFGVTMVIVQFGKIESLAGKEGLSEFVTNYRKLLDQLGANGRRLALLEPSDFEWAHADDAALQDYRAAVRTLAEKRAIPFVSQDEIKAMQMEAPANLTAAVKEKHRLWYDYWRPANWKCLFGDDSKRIFSNAAEGLPSFKQEWETFPALIAAAEEMIFKGEVPKPKPAPKYTGSGDADIVKEIAQFEVLDGYEVNLFADERHGVANPLAVRWDADGRMFVACSEVYPQIEPGVMPNDKVIALRDLDGDGVADESSVFAEGLRVPTGMEVGGDGVYIGHNTELVHFDWEGKRKLLLSGFGNGDSHQTSNGFAWSPGGELWFSQGDGIESRVETPFGVSSLFQAGVYRLRPRELKLDPLLDDFMGPGNPWGIGFDDYGQSFVIDGAGGISYLTPASVPVHRRLRLPRIGDPGGYAGIDELGDGSFGVGDYKKNQVTRFRTPEDGAGFKVDFVDPLLRSKHRNFRPIDVKLGPDGAIYVVDWYNPITCHQDDFYRHPERDKTHGRIWRVAKKGSSAKTPKLTKASEIDLIAELKSDNQWRREKAKQVLAARSLKKLPDTVRAWEGRDLLEAIGLAVWCRFEDRPLLERLLASDDHRCRAYAARIAGRWGHHDLLEIAADDRHPRVRMEAVLAAGQIPEAKSIRVAASVAGRPMDRWIEYGFKQAVHHLKPHWVSAFKRGELDFGGRGRGLARVLGEADSNELLGEIRGVLERGDIERGARVALARVLLAVGEPRDARFALALDSPDAGLLRELAKLDRPEFEHLDLLEKVFAAGDDAAKAAGWDLTRAWKEEQLRGAAQTAASTGKPGSKLRAAAIRAYGALWGEEAMERLNQYAEAHEPAAFAAMLDIDPDAAVARAAEVLARVRNIAAVGEIFAAFVAKRGAAEKLAAQLEGRSIDELQGTILRTKWIATGLVDKHLGAALDRLAGVGPGGYEYSEALIDQLVAAARVGDAGKGERHFKAVVMACASCHKVGDVGGRIGPDLSAVGSGVPPERIVTEVLWPTKQVKEGFALRRFTKVDGTVLQGYEQKSRDEGVVLVRDFATDAMHELRADAIAKRDEIGSLMPPTAQGLSQKEVADLLAYLFGLNGE
jgi:putative heme-binding domain-containing protein